MQRNIKRFFLFPTTKNYREHLTSYMNGSILKKCRFEFVKIMIPGEAWSHTEANLYIGTCRKKNLLLKKTAQKSCSLCGSILRKGRFKFVIIMIPSDRMGPQCRVNFYIEIFRDKSLNLFFKKARKAVSFVIASGSVLYWLIWNSVKSCSPGLLSRGRGSLTLFVKINYFQKHTCNSNLVFFNARFLTIFILNC